MNPKKYQLTIPSTRLVYDTFDQATADAKVLFDMGVKDVGIVAFRPRTVEDDY